MDNSWNSGNVPSVPVRPPLCRQVDRIRGHEAAEVGGVVAGAEVIQAGFGVAFFAGEVWRHRVVVIGHRGSRGSPHMYSQLIEHKTDEKKTEKEAEGT